MDNQMHDLLPDWRDRFGGHNETQLAKPVSACIVFARTAEWPDCHYPLRSRTYEVGSDNKDCPVQMLLHQPRSVPAWMAPTRWFASTAT